MTARPARLVLLATVLALLLGAAVGGISQMTAVSVVDPRPSVPPAVTPSPVPTPTPSPTPSPSPPVATATPEPRDEVWLYTIVEGDSLSGIAIRFGTTTDELLVLNPAYEDNQNLVQAGAQMILPCTPIAAAEDRC